VLPPQINLDIEVTNRCNADCYFCPRDQTPHQGLMSAEAFTRTLERATELREALRQRTEWDIKISLCGLGEPLINPRAIDGVRQVREAGFRCAMASNGSLLSEEKGRRLLDNGLQEIDINVGEEGEEYERIYGLPFERTRENVVRFAEMAEGRCQVNIVLVDHREDAAHRDHMVAFWRDQGLEDFVVFPLMNRGGALTIERMSYDDPAMISAARGLVAHEVDAPLCMAPFVFLFVGYDGKYYLCCSDWKKEASYGTVFDSSFVDVLGPKLEAVRTRQQVCHTCSIDPTNSLIDLMRGREAGTIGPGLFDGRVQATISDTKAVEELIEQLSPGLTAPAPTRRRRSLIPVRST
jgi:MoaA/NifB/PqqE/SkfB family radical SAM enzyme